MALARTKRLVVPATVVVAVAQSKAVERGAADKVQNRAKRTLSLERWTVEVMVVAKAEKGSLS